MPHILTILIDNMLYVDFQECNNKEYSCIDSLSKHVSLSVLSYYWYKNKKFNEDHRVTVFFYR